MRVSVWLEKSCSVPDSSCRAVGLVPNWTGTVYAVITLRERGNLERLISAATTRAAPVDLLPDLLATLSSLELEQRAVRGFRPRDQAFARGIHK